MKPVLPFLSAPVAPEKFVRGFFALGLGDEIVRFPVFLCAIDPFPTPHKFQPIEKIKISKTVTMEGNTGKHRFSPHHHHFRTGLRPDLDRIPRSN